MPRILFRSVALESQLNYTFEDLANRLSGTVLAGAKLYDTNAGASTSSSSVIMVISINLNRSNAERLLSMLTHDPSGGRVGDNVTVSGASIYQLHLPVDVLRSVAAANMVNSGFGGSPQYLNINTLVDFFFTVVALPYVLAISAFNFAASLAAMAANMGLQLVGYLASTISATVAAAQTAVVDAFNAFVAWAIEVIRNTLDDLLSPVVDAIKNLGNSYCANIFAASTPISDDIQNSRQVSIEDQSRLISSLTGGLFSYLTGLSVIVIIALAVLSFLTGPFGFLIGLIVNNILSTIMITALSSTIEFLDYSIDVANAMGDIIIGLLSWSGVTITPNDFLSEGIDFLLAMFEGLGAAMIFVCPKMPSTILQDIGRDVAMTVAGLMLSIWSVGLENDYSVLFLDIIAVFMSTGALCYSVHDLFVVNSKPQANSSPLIILGLTSLISFVGLAKSSVDVVGDWYEINE